MGRQTCKQMLTLPYSMTNALIAQVISEHRRPVLPPETYQGSVIFPNMDDHYTHSAFIQFGSKTTTPNFSKRPSKLASKELGLLLINHLEPLGRETLSKQSWDYLTAL